MRYLVYGIVVLLMVLHHDYWNWHTHEPLLFGFVPIGLAWHMGISIGAGLVWALAVAFAWPRDVDVLDEVGGASATSREGSRH